MENDEYERLMYGGVPVAFCNDEEQAAFFAFVLEAAGITAVTLRRNVKLDTRPPQVFVAPNDEQRARLLLSQPVAPEVLEEWQLMEEDNEKEWAAPACPVCQDSDPMLESSEPFNQWHCEACGHRWAEKGL